MTIHDKVRDEKIQYDIKKEAGKSITMNILQVKKYYPQIKEKWLNKVCLHILPQEKL